MTHSDVNANVDQWRLRGHSLDLICLGAADAMFMSAKVDEDQTGPLPELSGDMNAQKL